MSVPVSLTNNTAKVNAGEAEHCCSSSSVTTDYTQFAVYIHLTYPTGLQYIMLSKGANIFLPLTSLHGSLNIFIIVSTDNTLNMPSFEKMSISLYYKTLGFSICL